MNKLVNMLKGSKSRVLVVMAVMCLASLSLATDPVVGDYSAAVTQFRTDSIAYIGANGLLLLGCLAAFLAFGFVWRYIKKAAKS